MSCPLGNRVICFLGLLFLCPVVWAQQSPPADLRGIYIYTNDVSQITNATASQLTPSFGIAGVDGVAVVIGWDAIEPAMGQYQWGLLDQWLNRVIALGKKIDLVVPGGVATPSWLFQTAPAGAGATPLNFTITPHDGATANCQPETIAAPWDTAFLTQWDAMLSALSAHLKSTGTYDAITLLRLTGVNRTTEEFRLPAETPQSTGLACVSDAIATWQSAGYTPSLLLQGWTNILSAFRQSFPDKSFAVSIIGSNAFPAIAENGTLIQGTRPDPNPPLLAAANQMFPGYLVIQYDFLMPGEAVAPEVIQQVQTLGTMTAYQTNEYLGGAGAACSEPVSSPTPCTSATFLQMLQTGIYPLGQSNPLRAQYIEVFHDNASAFADAVQQGHLLLVPGPLTPGGPLIYEGGTVPIFSTLTTIQSGEWASIYGTNLAGETAVWKGDFPTTLGGTSVTIDGKLAYLWFVTQGQINFQAPDDTATGTVAVTVTTQTGTATSYVTLAPAAPSFLLQGDEKHVLAIVGTPGAPGNSGAGYDVIGPSRPVKPGETMLLFGVGLGPTTQLVPSGKPYSGASATVNPVQISIGGVVLPQTDVQFAGLISAGLYQINVLVPAGLGTGDQAITATTSSVQTQSNVMLTLQ
jgi:uncharacterized protein (TIGR03437 family)